MKQFQYQGKVDPLKPLNAVAAPSVASYVTTEVPQRNWNAQRQYSAASVMPSLSFVSLVNTPAFHSGVVNILQFPRLFQYQALAFVPLVTAAVPAPTLSWKPSLPDILNRAKATNYLYPASNDNFQANFVANAVIYQQNGYQPDRIYDAKRSQYSYPSYFRQGGSPGISESPFLGFSAPNPQALRGNRHLFVQNGVISPLSTPVNLTYAAWMGYQPAKVEQAKRQQHTYPFVFHYNTTLIRPQPSVTADMWLGYHPDYVWPVRNNLRNMGYQVLGYPWYSQNGCPNPIETTNWGTSPIETSGWVDPNELISGLNIFDQPGITFDDPGVLFNGGQLTSVPRTSPWAGQDPETTSWVC